MRIMTKIIVPIKPVTALNGISESVKDLENISVIIMNVAPNVTHNGMVLFASLPANNRTI